MFAALAAVAAWVVFDFRSQPEATKSQGTGGAGPAAKAPSEPLFGIPSRLGLGKRSSDPFSTHSWAPPPPKPGSTAAAPPPVAPPLPYRFVGQFYRDSGVEIYVGRGEEIFPVKQSDTIDGQYKVESVKTNEVAFVHLPTGTRQIIEFSALREKDFAPQPAKPGTAQASATPPAPAAKVASSGDPAPGAAIPAGPAQLRWDGPPNARAGASFNVALRVTSGEHIRAAPMQVRFDPKVLESVSVRPGRYFGGETGSFGFRVNPEGSIFVGASSQTPAAASDAEFLVLTFKPLRAGVPAEIAVSSLNLQGAAGRTIAYDSFASFRTTIAP